MALRKKPDPVIRGVTRLSFPVETAGNPVTTSCPRTRLSNDSQTAGPVQISYDLTLH